ncbi:MAG: PDZ domain-containing protein [Actinobacteria bacterium]|nr:PDZ domain-containing protein [Actinomycetota bacterium]
MEALGLKLAPLDAQVAERLNIDPATEGVVITEVDPESDAADKALRAGDVILEVNQDPVTAPGDVAEAVQSAQDAGRKSVLLRIERDGNQRFVAVRLGRR